MQITVSIYAFIIFYLIYLKMYGFALCAVLSVPFFILFCRLIKKARIKILEKKIKSAKESFDRGLAVTPFVKVNKLHWSYLALLPGVSVVTAKAVWRKTRKNKFKKIEDFVYFCNLEKSLFPFYEAIIRL